jgi:amino acid transporter
MTRSPETIAPGGRSDAIKRIVVGRPMATDELEDTLLPKTLALPIFASDPLSSVAYATESALVVLIAASAASAHLVFPLSIGIAALLAIVVLSYRQTVRAYETSGGAYVVAKENLGTLPSLVAAAALLTDYVLTVAVSVAAGIFAIVSIAPELRPHMVGLSLACVVLIALANLRGVRESGLLFALPTYAFVTAMLVLVGTGIARCAAGSCPTATVPHPLPAGAGAVTLFVLLRAFASGSTALTGVEAIANGVNAFRHPQGRNAAKTLAVLGAIAIVMFVGVSFLAVEMHARPSSTVSVVSQIARATFPPGSVAAFMYYAVQGLTLLVLVLAANTSFQGFPRLAALLARDGYFARQFTNLGDRLVFSNGILVLTVAASLLLWAYGASVDSLIHLYVIGVFTAFTLSQAGMVRYWLRRRERGWQRSAAINALGGTATGIVTCIVVVTKFAQGAWLVIVAIPLLVLGFYGVHRHYRRVGRRLRAGIDAVRAASPRTTNTTVLVVESLDEAVDEAVWYARQIADDGFRAIHVPGPRTDSGIRARWFARIGERPRLEVLGAETGRVDTAMEYLWTLPRGESEFVTVVIPELFRRRSLAEAVRRRLPFSLKLRLLFESGVAIADVPVVASEQDGVPRRVVARIFVSGVHAATVRAINYARTLGLRDTHAVYFAFGADDAAQMKRDWLDVGLQTPLEIVEAPFRDIGSPLLAYLRELTADPDVAVAAVMPEIVVRGWSRLLHNQRALYVKRLLLFEPRVILTSVPYQLFR